jgi:hypothetical protein
MRDERGKLAQLIGRPSEHGLSAQLFVDSNAIRPGDLVRVLLGTAPRPQSREQQEEYGETGRENHEDPAIGEESVGLRLRVDVAGTVPIHGCRPKLLLDCSLV